jgi:hypothetical protein
MGGVSSTRSDGTRYHPSASCIYRTRRAKARLPSPECSQLACSKDLVSQWFVAAGCVVFAGSSRIAAFRHNRLSHSALTAAFSTIIRVCTINARMAGRRRPSVARPICSGGWFGPLGHIGKANASSPTYPMPPATNTATPVAIPITGPRRRPTATPIASASGNTSRATSNVIPGLRLRRQSANPQRHARQSYPPPPGGQANSGPPIPDWFTGPPGQGCTSA